ncbi:MAG: ATP-binding protein [Eubacterium sp.]|nr:ATP-binding protein [Eubacterium sp.]
MFIGREKELKFLEDKYNETGGQLIVLYGRRRIGKTETLKEFCKGKQHIYFSCRECTDKLQLKNFSEQLFKENISAKQYINEFQDWEGAFKSVADLPYGDSKRLIVIDEFPYMCKENESIPSILQNLWDNALKNSNVMIILCGSAMSFIEKELLAEKNPLYGRATGIYKMQEMGFYDVVKFFPNYSNEDKVIVYSILGGIPHYLRQFNPDLSLEKNIKKNILTKGSVLYSEVEFLLRQELRETNVYNSIVQAVALGNTKLNDISQKALVEDNPKTSVYLKNLIELGIIKKEFSVDTSVKENANRNRGTYRIADNFFRFWYAFAFTNLSALETDDVDGVYEYSIKPNLERFASFAFEDVCKEFVIRQQKANKLPFRYNKLGKWWGKTTVRRGEDTEIAETEIDLLAISDTEKKYLVGECKFKKSPFSYAEFLDTEAKLAKEKEENEFYYILFSKSGFDEKIQLQTVTKAPILMCDLNDIV